MDFRACKAQCSFAIPFCLLPLQYSHIYSLFTGWKSLATAEIRRSTSVFLPSQPSMDSISTEVSGSHPASRFSNPAPSDATGTLGCIEARVVLVTVCGSPSLCCNAADDVDVARAPTDSSTLAGSVPGSEAPSTDATPIEAPTIASEDADEGDWAVANEEYHPRSKYAWIFSGDEELSATPTAQSAALATMLLGLYHSKTSVVSASLKQLETLLKLGWFDRGTHARPPEP